MEGPEPYDWVGLDIWIGAGAGANDELDPELDVEKDGPDGIEIDGPFP